MNGKLFVEKLLRLHNEISRENVKNCQQRDAEVNGLPASVLPYRSCLVVLYYFGWSWNYDTA